MKTKIEKLEFVQNNQGKKAFVTVSLVDYRMRISGITYTVIDGKRILQMPVKRFPKGNGEFEIFYPVSFETKELFDQFQQATLNAIDLYFGIGGAL